MYAPTAASQAVNISSTQGKHTTDHTANMFNPQKINYYSVDDTKNYSSYMDSMKTPYSQDQPSTVNSVAAPHHFSYGKAHPGQTPMTAQQGIPNYQNQQPFRIVSQSGYDNQNSQIYGSMNPQMAASMSQQMMAQYYPSMTDSQYTKAATAQYQQTEAATYTPISGYSPPQMQGYSPPQMQGYSPPQMQGYSPPQMQGYSPPQMQGYAPPQMFGSANTQASMSANAKMYAPSKSASYVSDQGTQSQIAATTNSEKVGVCETSADTTTSQSLFPSFAKITSLFQCTTCSDDVDLKSSENNDVVRRESYVGNPPLSARQGYSNMNIGSITDQNAQISYDNMSKESVNQFVSSQAAPTLNKAVNPQFKTSMTQGIPLATQGVNYSNTMDITQNVPNSARIRSQYLTNENSMSVSDFAQQPSQAKIVETYANTASQIECQNVKTVNQYRSNTDQLRAIQDSRQAMMDQAKYGSQPYHPLYVSSEHVFSKRRHQDSDSHWSNSFATNPVSYVSPAMAGIMCGCEPRRNSDFNVREYEATFENTPAPLMEYYLEQSEMAARDALESGMTDARNVTENAINAQQLNRDLSRNITQSSAVSNMTAFGQTNSSSSQMNAAAQQKFTLPTSVNQISTSQVIKQVMPASYGGNFYSSPSASVPLQNIDAELVKSSNFINAQSADYYNGTTSIAPQSIQYLQSANEVPAGVVQTEDASNTGDKNVSYMTEMHALSKLGNVTEETSGTQCVSKSETETVSPVFGSGVATTTIHETVTEITTETVQTIDGPMNAVDELTGNIGDYNESYTENTTAEASIDELSKFTQGDIVKDSGISADIR